MTRDDGLRLHALPLLIVLVASIAAVLPLVVRGPSCGHDFDFHLLSWIEAATDWRQGLAYPHWLVSANYEAGEPRFIFYPPVSWFLGAALGAVGSWLFGQHAGWTAAPLLLTWMAIFGSGCAVYALARGFVDSQAATVSACLFVANPYLLFVAYERTAYAELLSTGLIALLLLLALRPRIAFLPVSLLIAALWLTNAPAAVMGCYMLAFVAMLRMIRERRLSPGWRAGVSCALGTGLAGFYLVPAAWEQRWVQIDRAISAGMRVEDSFLFGHTGIAYHDQVLHSASVIATVVIGVGFLALAVAWLRQKGDCHRLPLLVVTALLVALTFLQLHVSYFLWRILPRMLFLQFPWRWLVVMSVCAALGIALALDGSSLKKPIFAALTILVAGGSIWACSRHFYLACDVDDAVAGQLTTFQQGSGVEGTDEYTAKNADNSAVLQDMPQVRVLTSEDAELPAANAGDNPEWPSDFYFPTTARATTKVLTWQAQHRRIQIDAVRPAFAILTLMDYPAWQVTLNGAPDKDHGQREDGLIALAIPAGRSVIDVQWKNTPDIYWGRWLSGVAAVLLMLVWFVEKRLMKAAGPSLRSG